MWRKKGRLSNICDMRRVGSSLEGKKKGGSSRPSRGGKNGTSFYSEGGGNLSYVAVRVREHGLSGFDEREES